MYKRQQPALWGDGQGVGGDDLLDGQAAQPVNGRRRGCLLYTSDAADERSCVDLGGRRIIKKKKKKKHKSARPI